jgi:hypothetical protein
MSIRFLEIAYIANGAFCVRALHQTAGAADAEVESVHDGQESRSPRQTDRLGRNDGLVPREFHRDPDDSANNYQSTAHQNIK